MKVAESEAGDESSIDILWKVLKMKLNTWTFFEDEELGCSEDSNDTARGSTVINEDVEAFQDGS